MKRALGIMLTLCMGIMSSPLEAAPAHYKTPVFTDEEKAYLKRIEKATFEGFDRLFDLSSDLPVDIAQIRSDEVELNTRSTHFNKTSPSHIAFGFTYIILARDRGFLEAHQANRRILRMLHILEQLDHHEGFLYDWYYSSGIAGEIPRVILDRKISPAQNAILDLTLMALTRAFPGSQAARRAARLLHRKDYHFFFDKNPNEENRGLLSTGYDVEQGTYADTDHSIFNSESRMAAFVAIVKDGVPYSAWKNQDRLLRVYATVEEELIAGIASWGGSLRETLLADEFLGGHEMAGKAFFKNGVNAVRIHRDKGWRYSDSGLWGFSKGGIPGEAKYTMSGVNSLAYRPNEHLFVTPYSTLLALRYDTVYAMVNLLEIERHIPEAFHPNYGFVDSLDPQLGVTGRFLYSADKGVEVLVLGNLLNAVEGRRDIPDYIWEYIRARKWDVSAEALLVREEENPAFLSLYRPREIRSQQSLLSGENIDVIEVSRDIGTFYNPGSAKAWYELVPSEDGVPVLEVRYDVRKRYTYSGLYMKIRDIDLTDHRALSFKIRGNPETGFPERIKVEVKWRGQFIQLGHVNLSEAWKDVTLDLPGERKRVDELAFVFENKLGSEGNRGEVFITSLTFT